MTQVYRPKWKHETSKLIHKQRGDQKFTRDVESFLILPNAKKTGIKISFKCPNGDGRYSYYYYNALHGINSENKEIKRMCREELEPFLKDNKKQFAKVVGAYALINKKEEFFKEIKSIKVYKKSAKIGRFGPSKSNCSLPHYVTAIYFSDGTETAHYYKFD